MQLTYEQAGVVSSRDRNLVVQAFAGTGKTSTLVEFARARPEERMLYLAFNKSVQLEAARKFPSNVDCRTTHSLAFASHGKKYAGKLGSPRAIDVAKALGITQFKHAKQALDTVMTWCCSADDVISTEHVPGGDDSDRKHDYATDIVQLAQRVWRSMVSESPDVPMPHDGYLKLFQLSAPDLSRYGRILFDESQDANPVTTAIVMRQKRVGVVMVGDAHQSIYQFRGARNAMNTAPIGWAQRHLTRSFRFGQGVAEVANVLLGLKGEKAKIVGGGEFGTEWGVDRGQRYTLIARTNASLLHTAVASGSAKLSWIGGVQSYPIDRVVDAWHLKAEERGAIRDQSFLSFKDFGHMKTYAEAVNDVELLVLVKLVEQYGSQLPELVADIRRRSIDDDQVADIVLTTAHRSKGLEWRQVVLADDYIDLVAEAQRAASAGLAGPLTPKGAEEINVLYVAATRALHRIELPSALMAYLERVPGLGQVPALRGLLNPAVNVHPLRTASAPAPAAAAPAPAAAVGAETPAAPRRRAIAW